MVTITRPLPNGKTCDTSFVVVYKVNAAGKVVSLRAFWEYEKAMQLAMEAMSAA